MKILEIRRHSFRKSGGGSQLSQEGVDHARKLGATMGPFARVVTSVVPRARETALAMGFAVDYELVTLVEEKAVFEEMAESLWWESAQPFVTLGKLLRAREATWRYANAQASLWRDILTGIPDGAAALVVGHSGELEIALMACFPEENHAVWGGPLGYCEGALLQFSGAPEHFNSLEFLRR